MDEDLPPPVARGWRRWAPTVLFTLTMVGVCAAVVWVNLIGSTSCCNIDATHIQIKKMEESLTIYAAKHKGKFPDRLEEVAKYLPDGEVPTDAWGNAFLYVPPGQYRILSLGRDGKVGGEGQDADVSSGPPTE